MWSGPVRAPRCGSLRDESALRPDRRTCDAEHDARLTGIAGLRGPGARLHAAFTPGWGFIHGAGRRLAPRSTPFVQERSMKRIVSLALLALFSMNFLVACNTVKGAGKDVEKVGEKVQQSADDTGATDPR
jgi:predicted small secreted protein